MCLGHNKYITHMYKSYPLLHTSQKMAVAGGGGGRGGTFEYWERW